MLSKFCIPLNMIPLRHQQSLSVDTLTLHIFIGAGMKLSSMLLISSLLGLAACNSGGGGGPTSNKHIGTDTQSSLPEGTQTEESSTLKVTKKRKVPLLMRESKFLNFPEFKENINNYKLTLEAKTGDYFGASVECVKSNFLDRENTKITEAFDESGLKAEMNLSIDDNDPMVVNFDCKVMDREVVVASTSVEIRKSFVVDGTQNIYALGIAGTSAIETLVLDDNSVLETKGTIIDLKMNELVSNKGTIATFSKTRMPTPVDNEPGKSGGILNILTEKAIGDIVFELRGGNAGVQTNKVPSKNMEAIPADPALNGTCKGYSNNFGSNDKNCWGKRGHPGKPGFDGFDGFDGGATGLLKFTSEQANKLRVSVQYYPGLESIGVAGGKGGTGGPGGKGNFLQARERNEPPHPHLKSLMGDYDHQYPHGERGVDGADGKPGINGNPGLIQTSEINFKFEEIKFEFNYDFKNY